MNFVPASRPPSGPADADAATSRSQGMAVGSTVTLLPSRPTTLLPSRACHVGPPKCVPHWIDHYNERRTHSALGNRTPLTRVREVTGLNS